MKLKYGLGRFSKRVLTLTAGLSSAYLLLLVTASCMEDPALDDPFGRCPDPQTADAVDLTVFYSPFENGTALTEADTVALGEFGFNIEITPELTSSSALGSFPGQAFALSCAATYNFKNISNISVILKAPFAGLPTGTDISFLLLMTTDSSLKDLKDFNGLFNFLGFRLNITPTDLSRLETQTFLFLRDGSRIVVDSKSPVLKLN